MAKTSGGREFLRTFGLIFLAMGALFMADMFLAKMERAESRAEAARLFNEGKGLLERGHIDEAINHIKDALAIERQNREYMRTLAQVQLTGGKTANAEQTLTELLQSDSTDGLANLIMARVLVKEGQFEAAVPYYHRAIFGRWNQGSGNDALRARFELIDLLAQRGTKEALLAELLPVQDEAPGDVKTRLRMGQLFLEAGSGKRAADVFLAILRVQPANADAHLGLGEAELLLGNYRTARNEYQATLRWKPTDETARNRLALCEQVVALDPTVHGLGPGQRFQRSLRLVKQTLDEATKCLGQSSTAAVQALLGQAQKAPTERVTSAREVEVAEKNVDLAVKLWQLRKKECTPAPPTDSPVALILDRAAR
jgi:tetratricopeptide (TPR) repeat protein